MGDSTDYTELPETRGRSRLLPVISAFFPRRTYSAAFDGQTVGRDHVLADKDVVELHV
jgi:hypothetical protein